MAYIFIAYPWCHMTPRSLSQLPVSPFPNLIFVPLWMLLFVLSPSPPSSRQRWRRRRRRRRRRRLAACSCCWLPAKGFSFDSCVTFSSAFDAADVGTHAIAAQNLATCCQHTSHAVDRKHALSLALSLTLCTFEPFRITVWLSPLIWLNMLLVLRQLLVGLDAHVALFLISFSSSLAHICSSVSYL